MVDKKISAKRNNTILGMVKDLWFPIRLIKIVESWINNKTGHDLNNNLTLKITYIHNAHALRKSNHLLAETNLIL